MNSNSTKDRQIIRQSMSKLSLEYFNSCGICPTIVDVIKTTTMLEDFCVNGYSKELIEKIGKLDKHIEEVYKNSGN
jgi:hypothetical protein